MKRRIAPTQYKVPYLPKQRIEREAAVLLGEYGDSRTPVTSPPVPIDEIIELHLRLAIEFKDMQQLFRFADVHGALWMKEEVVGVDQSLDPAVHPNKRGRYHFTLGHEAGHWRLHKPYYLEDPNQGELFEGGFGKPAYVCRSTEAKKPVEWQADFFAGCILMPREVVRSEWHAWRGNLDAVAVQQLPVVTIRNDPKENENAALERFCRPFAARFEVSAEAMRIRLEHLGFLLREVPNTLF